jgi:SOS-response transcriptional repressor LexA
MSGTRKTIPIASTSEADARLDTCAGAEPFALMVLGDSMAPEFQEGEIIVIEPDGHAQHGSYVLAQVNGEYTFRQLQEHEGRWRLTALNPRYPDVEIPDLSPVKGVVIQKQKPGSRRSRKSYLQRSPRKIAE